MARMWLRSNASSYTLPAAASLSCASRAAYASHAATLGPARPGAAQQSLHARGATGRRLCLDHGATRPPSSFPCGLAGPMGT